MPKTDEGLTAAEALDINKRLAALVERIERIAGVVEGKPPSRRNDLELIEGGKSDT